jgi:hypothetical protein
MVNGEIDVYLGSTEVGSFHSKICPPYENKPAIPKTTKSILYKLSLLSDRIKHTWSVQFFITIHSSLITMGYIWVAISLTGIPAGMKAPVLSRKEV